MMVNGTSNKVPIKYSTIVYYVTVRRHLVKIVDK